jgi:hypothetical protein
MSEKAREALVNSGRLIFTDGTQKTDLLDPTKTQTELIAFLVHLTQYGWFQVTAVRTDHSDDSALGVDCHANGYCIDGWPLETESPGDFLDPDSDLFTGFLKKALGSPFLLNIGLGGSAYTEKNMVTLAGYGFQDDGQDHVHLGTV